MSTDKIQEYLAPLRTHDARKPFESVESLLAQPSVRGPRMVTLAVWRVLMVCAVLAVLASGMWFGLGNRDSSKSSTASSKSTAGRDNMTGHTETTERLSARSAVRHVSSHAAATPIVTTMSSASRPDPTSDSSHGEELSRSTTAILKSEVLTTTSPLWPTLSNPSTRSSGEKLPLPSGINPVIDSDIAPAHNFEAFLQGGIAQQLSSDPLYQHFDANSFSVGFRYAVSFSSSFGISAGREVYASTLDGYSISYHDFISTHGEVTIHNVIGEVDPANSMTYWLGWSYRLTLGETQNFARPYAEVLAGAADLGAITHECIGVQLLGTSRFHVELSAEARQLYAGGGLVLQKTGVTMGVGYAW